MKLLLPLCFIFLYFSLQAQVKTWETTTDWKLYKIQGNEAFRCPVDSLKSKESVSLDKDSVVAFLSSATAWPKNKNSFWMGSFLISFEDKGHSLHKIDVSMYAGFLYDEQLKTYFQLTGEVKKEWMQFINDNYEKFLSHE